MLKNSFFANESATVKIQARQKKKKIEPIYEKAMDLQCPKGCEDQISELYNLIDLLWDANEEIASGQLPIPLTIVQVVTEKHLFKDAVVLRNHGNHKSLVCIFWLFGDAVPVAYEEENLTGDFETAVQRARFPQVLIPGTKKEFLCYECIEVTNCMITSVYNE